MMRRPAPIGFAARTAHRTEMKSADSSTAGATSIVIEGARQNNLKNVSLALPLNELIVVTGVSGSGKSSLVFDTLYAEGQRRYVETFSPYARQFLDRMDKPQVDAIHGIPPAIAIDQTNQVRTSRSTVGTPALMRLLRRDDAHGREDLIGCLRRLQQLHGPLQHQILLRAAQELGLRSKRDTRHFVGE